MGAVNYATSDYVTLGVDLNRICDPDEIAELFDAVQSRVDNFGVWGFDISVKPGYYDGFTLDISYDFPVFFEHSVEKRDALEEVTTLKRFLLSLCTDFGLVAVHPGWCTGYCTPVETCAEIAAAAAEMRKDVKETPTYLQYCRGGEIVNNTTFAGLLRGISDTVPYSTDCDRVISDKFLALQRLQAEILRLYQRGALSDAEKRGLYAVTEIMCDEYREERIK